MVNEPWYKSKTKVGGVLIGASLILGAVGKYLTGDVDPTTAVQTVLAGLGSIATIIGIRDAIENIMD